LKNFQIKRGQLIGKREPVKVEQRQREEEMDTREHW
jgi:hypothetical protein